MTGQLWQDYITRGEEEVARVLRGQVVVERDACPVESTPFGLLRWYTHPRLPTPVSQALYQFELEIPVGSRTGRLRHQGGIVHYVLSGSGVTEMDGKTFDWEAEDVIGIPTRPAGVEFVHVNTGSTPARMMVAMANLDSALGPFQGVRTEVVEPAPEFDRGA